MLQKARDLTRGVAIYGVGDVAIQLVNFLLLRVYVLYLSAADYGVLALLTGVEGPIKLFFRWGIDGAFMRFWHDCETDTQRRELASTLFFFLLIVNGALLVPAFLLSPWLSNLIMGTPTHAIALQVVLVNLFAIGFTFIPFHVMRLENRAVRFSALTFGRSLATLVLRLVLIVGMGMGVMGVVVADLAVTALLVAVMWPSYRVLIRPAFSMALLTKSLRFGLPRIPHGLALQVMAVGDRFVLRKYVALADVGTYSIGASFGLIPKIALGAFEYAWAPFYYATAREPGAARIFSVLTTYGIAVLATMTAGLAATVPDLLHLVTRGTFSSAAGVAAWTAVGVFFYGTYLLTSIGLNITSHTQFYPVSTAAGATLSLLLNFLLIPKFGIIGAAWAATVSYASQASIAYFLSQRFYPIAYEWNRITRAVLAAILSYIASRAWPEMEPLTSLAVRGSTVVVVMLVLLWLGGFLNAQELRIIRRMRPFERFGKKRERLIE